MTLLPPNATRFERALEDAACQLADVPVPLRQLWNPATCPVELLPWLAWGVSIDFWSSDWTEAEKRAAIATAIEDQRRKGTPTSLREVLDRFDPMIGVVEWFEDKVNLAPHTFRLELPLADQTLATYDAPTVAALLRDIAAVKPLRSHMLAVHRLFAQAHAGLISAARVGTYARIVFDAAAPLLTESGEMLLAEDGTFLEFE